MHNKESIIHDKYMLSLNKKWKITLDYIIKRVTPSIKNKNRKCATSLIPKRPRPKRSTKIKENMVKNYEAYIGICTFLVSTTCTMLDIVVQKRNNIKGPFFTWG